MVWTLINAVAGNPRAVDRASLLALIRARYPDEFARNYTSFVDAIDRIVLDGRVFNVAVLDHITAPGQALTPQPVLENVARMFTRWIVTANLDLLEPQMYTEAYSETLYRLAYSLQANVGPIDDLIGVMVARGDTARSSRHYGTLFAMSLAFVQLYRQAGVDVNVGGPILSRFLEDEMIVQDMGWTPDGAAAYVNVALIAGPVGAFGWPVLGHIPAAVIDGAYVDFPFSLLDPTTPVDVPFMHQRRNDLAQGHTSNLTVMLSHGVSVSTIKTILDAGQMPRIAREVTMFDAPIYLTHITNRLKQYMTPRLLWAISRMAPTRTMSAHMWYTSMAILYLTPEYIRYVVDGHASGYDIDLFRVPRNLEDLLRLTLRRGRLNVAHVLFAHPDFPRPPELPAILLRLAGQDWSLNVPEDFWDPPMIQDTRAGWVQFPAAERLAFVATALGVELPTYNPSR